MASFMQTFDNLRLCDSRPAIESLVQCSARVARRFAGPSVFAPFASALHEAGVLAG
jgi:hypothetical protein